MEPKNIAREAERRKTTHAEARFELNRTEVSFLFFESSRALITKILTGDTYPIIPFIENVDTIFDVGASVGAASLFFHSRYPGADIWAFEPHGGSYGLLKTNTTGLGKVKTFNVGLFDRHRQATLNLSKYDYPTNSIGDCVYNSDAGETVTLENAAEFAARQGIGKIDILKLDTEGCERPILRGLLSDFAPRVIYLEYHSEKDRLEIDRMLGRDYILYFGAIPYPHRGELCYVAKSAVPADDPLMRLEIDVGTDGSDG
ncbi:MAG: FkbM family methyltransferase [Rhodospirillales bacterium]|nr:FkbM family methyltransferase [Rhodospirillales bacterium]